MFSRKKHRLDEDERCFPNPHLKDTSCLLSGAAEPKAEISLELLAQLRKEVDSNLPLIDHAYQAPSHDHSVYTGTTGIALLHFHMATSLYTDNPAKHSSHLHSALSLLTPSLQHPSTKRSTFLCGGAGPLALGAVCHAHLGQWGEVERCVWALKELYTKHKSSFASLPSELLTGHAGYLYALLFLNSHLPTAIEEELIAEVATILLDAGEQGREPGLPCPLMYTWHDKHYLGAAHGLAGILTLLLQVPVPSLRPRITSLVQPCVDYLLGLRLPSGNLPSSLESSGSDRLVHWCHGAPGFTHLLAHAYRVFGVQQYMDAAVESGEVVWRRGLLRKGYGLCHGVSGNGYCFLQLHRLTGRPEYLHRAAKFAEWCLSSSERECRTPDRPFSLFEGLAGTVYFYVDLLAGVESARFPALELPVVKNTLTPSAPP